MASKTSRTTNFSEQEKLLLAELGRDFPEVEGKGYHNKTLTKKAKAWEEILTRFNSQNPNGIKRDLSQLQGCWRRLKLHSKKEHDLKRREARKTGGGKAPASPSEVSKLVADAPPASVNPLEQKFDDDAGGQLDLRHDKDVREVITCEVEPCLLVDLEAIGGKKAEEVTKKEDNQKSVIFNRYSNFSDDNLLHNSQLLIIRSHYINRYKRKKTESLEEDPCLSVARDEHKLKIKVQKLKEWKLVHQCHNMRIGLPPAYNTDEEHSQSNLSVVWTFLKFEIFMPCNVTIIKFKTKEWKD